MSSTEGAARAVLLFICCAAVAFSFVAAIRARIRTRTAVDSARPSGTARSPGAGVAIGSGSPVSGLLLIVSALLGVGWLVLGVSVSLGRHLGPEQIAAVEEVERWKVQHPGWSPTRRNGD